MRMKCILKQVVWENLKQNWGPEGCRRWNHVSAYKISLKSKSPEAGVCLIYEEVKYGQKEWVREGVGKKIHMGSGRARSIRVFCILVMTF